MSLMSLEARLVPLRTVFNFRDFGGYAGRDGRPVRTGRLFRSAHLANVSKGDAATLDALDMGLILDFRHAPERRQQPSVWSGSADVLTQPEAQETLSIAPHEAFAREKLHTAEDARAYMLGSYGRRMSDPSFQALHRDALLRMTDDGDAAPGVLVHCAAGKDRTGTFVALVQSLLGVSRDDILADYMLTETAVDIEAILPRAARMYSERHGRTITVDALRPMFGVEPEFLDAALDDMGDGERYAVEVLGVAPNRLERLRERYLAA